jgi:hypothetical protein
MVWFNCSDEHVRFGGMMGTERRPESEGSKGIMFETQRWLIAPHRFAPEFFLLHHKIRS